MVVLATGREESSSSDAIWLGLLQNKLPGTSDTSTYRPHAACVNRYGVVTQLPSDQVDSPRSHTAGALRDMYLQERTSTSR